jgi:glycine cleavage system aminomethyltransferase T
MSDTTLVPAEGEQFVHGGGLVGRVTSARYSPTLAKPIGLGWVKSEYAAIGSRLNLRKDDGMAQATVFRVPFYDPEGIRVRS